MRFLAMALLRLPGNFLTSPENPQLYQFVRATPGWTGDQATAPQTDSIPAGKGCRAETFRFPADAISRALRS